MAKLYFYYSAMNAGKSTLLLQANHNYHERGMKTVMFTPEIDTRYGSGIIGSRLGLIEKAVRFNTDFNFYAYLEACLKEEPSIRCILIDEAQFLSKNQVLALKATTEAFSIPVLTYGLRTDYRGEPFEGSIYLLAWAETLIELKTICYCGRKATMNLLIDEKGYPVRQGEPICIGGNEKYIATCYRHFKAERKYDLKRET